MMPMSGVAMIEVAMRRMANTKVFILLENILIEERRQVRSLMSVERCQVSIG